MVMIETEIRDVTNEPLGPDVELIRRSFQTVADEMGITPENAPRYTAFITMENLEEERERGTFYGLFLEGRQIGFVSIEQEPDGRWHMRRLAVLPEYRKNGLARRLINRVILHVKARGGNMLSIGIVDEQRGLKDWYRAMGFREYEHFTIPDLPFSVSLLEMDLTDKEGV